MTYLQILTDICSRVADPDLDTYKERAKDHFLRALTTMVTSGEYIDSDIRGYIKLKTDLSFATNPYDASALKILKIAEVMPNPLLPSTYSAYYKEFEELKLVSQISKLYPEATEVFIYMIGINIYALYRTAPGAEVLDETDFATDFIWAPLGDFDLTGGVAAVFTWSANQTSELETAQGDLLVTAEGSKLYKFTYTIDVTTPFDGDGVATITTDFALTAVPLSLEAGTHTVYFMSAVAPTDFIIRVVSGSDTEGTFSFDNVSLKKMAINSNFNPDSDELYMKYVEIIDSSTWVDATILNGTPYWISLNFLRRGIEIASKTLLDEVNL